MASMLLDIPYWRTRSQPIRDWLQRHRKPLTLVAGVIFFAGIIWSLRDLRLGLDDIAWGPLALLAFVLVPFSLLYGGTGLQLLAKVAGLKMTASFAFRRSALAQLAEILPIPGGAIVRAGALMSVGAKVGEGAVLVLAAAFLWIAIAASGAGIAIYANGENWGWAIILSGTMVTATILIWIGNRAGWIGALQILAHRLFGIALTALRVVCAFAVIGTILPFESGLLFAFATIAGSAAAIAPAGLGISEIFSAALAPVVSIPPATAFLAVAMNRMVGLSVTALFVLLTGGGKPEPGGEAVE
ncbi:hypothetical protein [Sphingorhabdus sp. 109]|jgi:hypothetical protein|uniref:hypothetical protein n=1 Tax=Sphingorhabdus sp. 109 TaxID=2653173 RepID=UPI0012F13BD3|nr:hypothetical protein [Sphingorhabdus sp. 109]VWX58452.1 conserved membrane hypothetical protein [Sphingorhabdus sp. 109]